MAFDTSNGVTYFLSLPVEHKDYLGAIRHWNNLKIAFEEGVVWVKDFTAVQINSIEVKTIPHKQLFYSSANKLFLLGSRLPNRNIPSVLWTAIERGLSVKLPNFNHNYFGIEEKVHIKLISTDAEKDAFALMVEMDQLSSFIETASAIRLRTLTWAIIDENKAIVLGVPLLPLQGDVFWRKNDFLLPAGYDFDLFSLADILANELNAENDYWIIWSTDSNYWRIRKNVLKPLTISSFRLSIKE